MHEWWVTSAVVGVVGMWAVQVVGGVGVGLVLWTRGGAGGWWKEKVEGEGEGEVEGEERRKVGPEESEGPELAAASALLSRVKGQAMRLGREGEPGAPGEAAEVDEYKLTGEDVLDALDRAFPPPTPTLTPTPTSLRHRPTQST